MSREDLLYFETHQKKQNKEWVVFVHGAGGSTRTWKRQVDDLGAHYNLLIMDLPGHGQNAGSPTASLVNKYTVENVAARIWQVVDHLSIPACHIIGISMGTIICLQMRIMRPQNVLSVIMPGAIVRLNTKLKMLANLSLTMAKVIGYEKFYAISARIMMPRNNHKKSRDVFIKESKVLTTEEFRKWTSMYYDLNATLKKLFNATSEIPHILVMGDQDHLFLKPARAFVKKHSNAILAVIPKCGHVVSIEQAQKFNRICLSFLQKITASREPNI